MAVASSSLLWCHFSQTYHCPHLLIYFAVHKRGPESLLPAYYLPESYHQI